MLCVIQINNKLVLINHKILFHWISIAKHSDEDLEEEFLIYDSCSYLTKYTHILKYIHKQWLKKKKITNLLYKVFKPLTNKQFHSRVQFIIDFFYYYCKDLFNLIISLSLQTAPNMSTAIKILTIGNNNLWWLSWWCTKSAEWIIKSRKHASIGMTTQWYHHIQTKACC